MHNEEPTEPCFIYNLSHCSRSKKQLPGCFIRMKEGGRKADTGDNRRSMRILSIGFIKDVASFYVLDFMDFT